ncbi:hypothetical protein [Actinocorallia aurantiaca]|uniref:Uncharacterized protein n=1 Tax=Actinocorallia aurantiaca TaxID=46204 RepID=A0ABN3UAV4_9ACTN
MSTFSLAEFETATSKITSGMKDISAKIPELKPAAAATANKWYVPDIIGNALVEMAGWAADLAKTILDKIIDVIEGLFAPIKMFYDASKWSSIQSTTETVASDIGEERIKRKLTEAFWEGPATEAYLTVAKAQGTAATRVSSMADTIKTTLNASAVAGLVFYVAIAVIVIKFLAAMISMIVEFGIVIASLFGVATIIEEAGTVPLAIAAAVGGLLAFLGPQIETLINNSASLESGAGLDGGHWPKLATGTFSDATVKDGDADWSVQDR